MPNHRVGNRRSKSYDSAMCPAGLYNDGLGFLTPVTVLAKELTWLGLGNT